MAMPLDLTDKKFTRLTAKMIIGKNKYRQNVWLCECDCGNKVKVTAATLKTGKAKSCGCYTIERIKEVNTKHGFAKRSGKSKFYILWKGIRQRCNDINCKSFNDYGGRGITYDPRWGDFLEFKKDMYMSYLIAIKQTYRDVLSKNY